MKRLRAFIAAIFTCIILLAISGCESTNMPFEENVEIRDYTWNLDFKPSFTVEIDDTASLYNVYVNVRHTSDYKYSNLWVRMTTQLPDSTTSQIRHPLALADKTGKWFGHCLGDICDVQTDLQKNVSFKKPGKYTFQLEQLMRTTDLEYVMSVGVRVEKAS